MTRENVKKNIDIISAFAEGKVIQISNEIGEWVDLTEREGLPMGTLEETPDIFRVKPEPKYRPFANAEECWTEMKKHQPFGWVKRTMKNGDIERLFMIVGVQENCIVWVVNGAILHWEFNKLFEAFYCFADGVPFGVKVEE